VTFKFQLISSRVAIRGRSLRDASPVSKRDCFDRRINRAQKAAIVSGGWVGSLPNQFGCRACVPVFAWRSASMEIVISRRKTPRAIDAGKVTSPRANSSRAAAFEWHRLPQDQTEQAIRRAVTCKDLCRTGGKAVGAGTGPLVISEGLALDRCCARATHFRQPRRFDRLHNSHSSGDDHEAVDYFSAALKTTY
jgi:hypothetical protein